jgi:type I restriction enzyme, S subunit
MTGTAMVSIAELEARGEASLQTGPFGTQLKASDYAPEGTPVINVRNVGFGEIRGDDLEYLPESKAAKLWQHRLQPGDIVFGRKGAVERHALIDEHSSGWIQGSDCLRLRLRSPTVCERYLSYYLRTAAHQYWIQALCSFGATMSSLNQDILRRLTFPAPRLAVQQKIAAILSAYDALIANNQRRIALLERMAEELYRECFVRLRFPGHQQVKIEKGVPQGWHIRKLPDICDITYGYPFQGDRFNDAGVGRPIIRIRNIPNSSTSDYTDEVAAPKYMVRAGDLLIGMDGDFHINHWLGPDAYLVQRSCRVKARNPLLDGYIARAIIAPLNHFQQTIVGATVGHLGAKHLKSIDILVPSDEQTGQLESLNALLKEKLHLGAAIRNAQATRDALLPRLISGKLAVDKLDIRFPPGIASAQERA